MDCSRNCVQHHVLVFSHSYVRHLATYCRAHGLRNLNLGFPKFYFIKLVGLPGATIHAFETWNERIVRFQPELIIIDLGGNDVARPAVSLDEEAAEMLMYI